jgi:hypothetical protein
MNHFFNGFFYFLKSHFIQPAVLVFCVFFSDSSAAQDKFSFTGYGAAGFSAYDRNQLREYNQVSYYEGKLQFNYIVNKHIEAQLDLRGNSDDNRIILREFSAKFEYIKLLRFKVGNIKKPFGSEQLLEKEELATIDRSYVQNTISDYGYGGRGVSVMAYYNYNKKRSDYPYSYFVSFYKDNSFNSGVVMRGAYHFGDVAASVNYEYLNKGGEFPISGQGLCANLDYEGDEAKAGLAVFYVRNPYESLRRRQINLSDGVYTAGVSLSASYKFDTGAEVIKEIEPVLLLGCLTPDIDETKYNTLEMIIGGNFYFHKDVRLRLHGDLLLNKSMYNSSYSSAGSKFTVELMACF